MPTRDPHGPVLDASRWRPAALVIDMHRGHLDPTIATMPVPNPEPLVERAAALLDGLRTRGVPIVFTVLRSRRIPGLGRDALANPYRRATVAAETGVDQGWDLANHNLEDTPQGEVLASLGPRPGDYVIATKRRFGSFYGTDLEILLRSLRVDTLLLLGVNTNTCVTCAAFEAYNRDLRVVLIEDCSASGYDPRLHDFAVENIRRCVGWVRTSTELLDELDRHPVSDGR
ncbi:cysteine hydrolase family protein [Micromonospora sp. NPDC005113]